MDYRGAAIRLLRGQRLGTITLSRITRAADEAPGQPGDLTATTVYTLDAVARGVTAGQVDGTLILASDLMVVASPKARTASGAIVELEPTTSDTLSVDGAAQVIKKVQQVPAAGPAASYRIFVAS